MKRYLIGCVTIAIASTAAASDVRLLPYANRQEVVREPGQDAFVICDSCPPVSGLVLRPKPLALGIRLSTPAPETTKPPVTEELPRATRDIACAVGTVHFDLDSAKLRPDETQNLIASVAHLTPQDRVFVYGYTCDIGSESHNLGLSLRRAEAVAAFLETRGIKISEVKGMGESALSTTDKALNRRVEIIIREGGSK